jgi:asparagine synthase (glutamine-hydrolysing)
MLRIGLFGCNSWQWIPAMCGLTFIFDQSSDEEILCSRTVSALQLLRHRGPDGNGMDSETGWCIGHCRLAIIDLQGSPQPMWDPSQRYCIAYNGEVYNYQDLRGSLAGQWSFATIGDTEVVLAGLILKGSSFLDRMEGMWALALWDRLGKQLLLARDRMGKKPLYYRMTDVGMACASELPALKRLSPDGWEEDIDSTADYLRYGYMMPGYSAYRGVREVLPGHVLNWSPGARANENPYWQLVPDTYVGNRHKAAEQLREALIRSVERRLVADVEVGAFLSGGIDSSLVVGIVRRELGRPLKTFTIGFEERSFDERQYASKSAELFGTDHYEETLGMWNESELEDLILNHVGQPFADSSLLPMALVSQVAAGHVKVALSGDGGDELFSGYQRYQARMIMRWYTRLPKTLRNTIRNLLRRMPEPMEHHSRSLLKKAHLFADAAEREGIDSPYFAPLMFSPEQMGSLAPNLAEYGHDPPGLPEETTPDDLQRMMLADARVYLPQDILVKVDRASMAHSLEARAPFLDRGVVELAFKLPTHWHRRGFEGKRMLRESLGKLLPMSVWRRRKQGFGVPLHDWFRGTLGMKLEGLLSEDAGLLEPRFVLGLLGEHAAKLRDHGYRLWLIYIYLLWRREQS